MSKRRRKAFHCESNYTSSYVLVLENHQRELFT